MVEVVNSRGLSPAVAEAVGELLGVINTEPEEREGQRAEVT